jgi:putative membrane protein
MNSDKGAISKRRKLMITPTQLDSNEKKNQSLSKFLIVAVTAALSCGTLLAQSHPGGGSAQPTTPNQQQNSDVPTTGSPQQSMQDSAFLHKALEGGVAEVQLGQLAQEKSQSGDVKQFGQRMVQDHTQLGTQMQPVAKQLGVSQPKGPSKKDKQLISKLQGLSGQQFDEEYIKAMVKDHREDLKDFKTEAEMTQDPNVKQAAQQGESVISEHLKMIEQIAQAHNVPLDGKEMSSK